MTFPESPRVLYQDNPLEEVICQLRFPPILRIDSEVPAGFQEQIREEYPLVSERQSTVQGPIPEELSKLLAPFLGSSSKAYDFSSADRSWKVSLNREFLALSCARYERWEVFWERLSRALQALRHHYRPSFLSRTGLRYRNVIVRSKLRLGDVNWSELLKPHVAGELDSIVAASIQDVTRQLLVRLDQHSGRVNIQHGTARMKDTNEECYYIDSDLFGEGRAEIDHAQEILNYFNRESGRLFRWCINERLHGAMGPIAI